MESFIEAAQANALGIMTFREHDAGNYILKPMPKSFQYM